MTTATSSAPRLSPRQREILRLLSSGFADKQVADMLGMSLATERTHLRRLSARFRAHGRVDLLVKSGVITFDDTRRNSNRATIRV